MLGRLKNLLRANRVAFGLTVFALVLTAVYFTFTRPLSPAGNYRAPLWGTATAHIVFQDGKVYVRSLGTSRCVNIYFKSGDQWLLGTNGVNQFILLPSVFGITVINARTGKWDEYLPRTNLYWIWRAKILGENTADFFKVQLNNVF